MSDNMDDFGFDGDDSGAEYIEKFNGSCIGVGLSVRGTDKNDRHVMVDLTIEDDGCRFPSGFSVSSYWIDEAIRQLTAAKKYMMSECSKDMVGKKQYGYKFKKSQLP